MEFSKSLLLSVFLISSLLSGSATTRIFNDYSDDSDDAPTTQTLKIAPAMAPIVGGFLRRVFNPLGRKMDPGLKAICTTTEHPDLCATTIAPFMADDSVDPVKALETEISACLNHTKKTLDDIIQLSDERNSQKDMHDVLEICKDNYDSILEYLKKAVDAFESKDLGTAQTMLSAVISMHSTCKDTFDEAGVECPFSADSEKVFQLAGNSLDIFVVVTDKYH